MELTLKKKLEVIIRKYETLGLNTPLYLTLKKMVLDTEWLQDRALVMNKITNSEHIFDISKQINSTKNDVRLDEAFAELDTAKNLATTKFYGDYDTVTYQLAKKNQRWPDLLAENKFGITPVEVKLLTPQGLNETKFFQKFIDKVNNDALPQLDSYYEVCPFSHGYVFVWSYLPVPLQNQDYEKLRKWVDDKIDSRKYQVTLMCNFYGIGMWDFPVKSIT